MTYLTSDIHGHYDKYKSLLSEISFRSTDILFILGDIIDRGNDGIEILQDMMTRHNIFPLLGNHEFTAAICLKWILTELTETAIESLTSLQLAALTEWLQNGGGPTLRSLKKIPQADRQDILEYLLGMPLYNEIEVGGRSFVLAHAALDQFQPDKELEEYQLPDFIFGRPTPESTFWTHQTLIFGHTPTRILWEAAGETPRDDIFFGNGFIDIDCGCGFGGPLGCLCLETNEEIYV